MAVTKTKFPVTPPGRVACPTLYNKESFEDGDPQYSVVLLFPPDADLKGLKGQIKRCAVKKFGDDVNLNTIRTPIKDCATKEYEGYEDGWSYIRFARKTDRPLIVDGNGKDLAEEDQNGIYGGCWARVKYDPFAFTKGGKGVALSLIGIQKCKDDDRFSSGEASIDSADDFDDEFGFEAQEDEFDDADDDLDF